MNKIFAIFSVFSIVLFASSNGKYLFETEDEDDASSPPKKEDNITDVTPRPKKKYGIVGCIPPLCDPACFPGTSLVMLDGGQSKRMEQLKIGDTILTMGNGKLKSTKIIGFLDKKVNKTADYLNMSLDDGKRLFISHRHTMFVKQDDEMKSILAQDVSIGDMVTVSDGKESGFSLVKDMRVVAMTGAYVPLTESGTLLVDGVLVSSYTNTQHHWLAHAAFAPIRWFPNLLLDDEESQYMEGIRTFPRLLRSVANIFGLVTLADEKHEKCIAGRQALPPFQIATQKMNNEL